MYADDVVDTVDVNNLLDDDDDDDGDDDDVLLIGWWQHRKTRVIKWDELSAIA